MEVDETDVPNVKVGQRATVTIDAYPNKTYEGLVTEVGSSPMVSQGTGGEAVNFEVKIQLTNPPAGVRPGFSASADIITGTREESGGHPAAGAGGPREAGQQGRQAGRKRKASTSTRMARRTSSPSPPAWPATPTSK